MGAKGQGLDTKILIKSVACFACKNILYVEWYTRQSQSLKF